MGIAIGFCTENFRLNGELIGLYANSIGIGIKGAIAIDGSFKEFGNDNGWFKKRNVIGIGLIQRPNTKMECFVTFNGKLLGKIISNYLNFFIKLSKFQ